MIRLIQLNFSIYISINIIGPSYAQGYLLSQHRKWQNTSAQELHFKHESLLSAPEQSMLVMERHLLPPIEEGIFVLALVEWYITAYKGIQSRIKPPLSVHETCTD